MLRPDSTSFVSAVDAGGSVVSWPWADEAVVPPERADGISSSVDARDGVAVGPTIACTSLLQDEEAEVPFFNRRDEPSFAVLGELDPCFRFRARGVFLDAVLFVFTTTAASSSSSSSSVGTFKEIAPEKASEMAADTILAQQQIPEDQTPHLSAPVF